MSLIPREECYACMDEYERCYIHDPDRVPLHPHLAETMRMLPPVGTVMNASQRQAFLERLDRALGRLYPGRQPSTVEARRD